jgi:hypothetical protein
MKIYEPMAAWFREHDMSKKLMIILAMIIWCLIVIFYFNSGDEMFYRD